METRPVALSLSLNIGLSDDWRGGWNARSIIITFMGETAAGDGAVSP